MTYKQIEEKAAQIYDYVMSHNRTCTKWSDCINPCFVYENTRYSILAFQRVPLAIFDKRDGILFNCYKMSTLPHILYAQMDGYITFINEVFFIKYTFRLFNNFDLDLRLI